MIRTWIGMTLKLTFMVKDMGQMARTSAHIYCEFRSCLSLPPKVTRPKFISQKVLHLGLLYLVRTWTWMSLRWSRSPGHFRSRFTVLLVLYSLTNLMGRGYVGQGRSQAHDIGSWAHINVKLFFLANLTTLSVKIFYLGLTK